MMEMAFKCTGCGEQKPVRDGMEADYYKSSSGNGVWCPTKVMEWVQKHRQCSPTSTDVIDCFAPIFPDENHDSETQRQDS